MKLKNISNILLAVGSAASVVACVAVVNECYRTAAAAAMACTVMVFLWMMVQAVKPAEEGGMD